MDAAGVNAAVDRADVAAVLADAVANVADRLAGIRHAADIAINDNFKPLDIMKLYAAPCLLNPHKLASIEFLAILERSLDRARLAENSIKQAYKKG
jgi:hypothetical protein